MEQVQRQEQQVQEWSSRIQRKNNFDFFFSTETKPERCRDHKEVKPKGSPLDLKYFKLCFCFFFFYLWEMLKYFQGLNFGKPHRPSRGIFLLSSVSTPIYPGIERAWAGMENPTSVQAQTQSSTALQRATIPTSLLPSLRLRPFCVSTSSEPPPPVCFRSLRLEMSWWRYSHLCLVLFINTD